MYNQIYSAISCAVRQGKMSTRVAIESCQQLREMEYDGTCIKDWRFEEGCIVITTSESTFTL